MICNKFHIFAVKIVSLKERILFFSTFEDKNNRHTKESRNSMTNCISQGIAVFLCGGIMFRYLQGIDD